MLIDPGTHKVVHTSSKNNDVTLVGLMANFGAHRADGDGLDDLSPRFNGSPAQDYPIIVREPDVAGAVFMRARWGFIPRWMKDPNGGSRPINCQNGDLGPWESCK